MSTAQRTSGLPTLYRVDVQDTKGHWHKAHARPFKTRAAAAREMSRHGCSRLMAKYPGAWGWMEIDVRSAKTETAARSAP